MSASSAVGANARTVARTSTASANQHRQAFAHRARVLTLHLVRVSQCEGARPVAMKAARSSSGKNAFLGYERPLSHYPPRIRWWFARDEKCWK
eukprot:6411870-Pyramimonas_sp.AAC.1